MGNRARWITAAVSTPLTGHPDACGLDAGVPAVAFLLHAANQPCYATALATLDRHTETIVRQRLTQAHHRIDAGRPPALREYDLISGLTGLGVYLLQRGDTPLLDQVLVYLVRLTEPITLDGTRLPGWWTWHAPSDRPSPDWSGGHANLGLAHGIAGPLALLAYAMTAGRRVTGQAEAIHRICRWLDRWCTAAGRDAWWPETVNAAEYRAGAVGRTRAGRPSWCYGTPGLARAQQLAGIALDDGNGRRHAEQALAGCLDDPGQVGQLVDATICHGWAGLLLTATRVAADAAEPELFNLPELLRCTVAAVHRAGAPATGGLLDGVAGVHLALRDATVGTASATGWDACLLLQPPNPRVERTS